MQHRALAFVVLGVWSMSTFAEIEVPPLPTPSELAQAPSFAADDRIVATHYFYWYRWPDEHFFDDRERTDDSLRQHFPDPREVSYASQSWHRRQLEDLRAAGIDVALCVYWGAPNQYEKPEIRFSVLGLPPLAAALDEMAADGGDIPRVGLFYDTSTLLGGHAFREPDRGNVDLRTAEGRDIFYRTIRDFFRFVPPRHWACIDGRPLVQLYNSGFATGHDQQVIDEVYERFAADFAGRRPFIVSGPSWSVEADAKTGWGAALNGPILGGYAAQVGPGYDDSPVPGRTTPTRDRLGGGFYAASWLLALQSQPHLVIIETWNELHEGTGICDTLEDGRFYIDLTRKYADMFRQRRVPAGDDWAAAVRELLGARQSNPDGREYASRIVLSAEVAADGTLREEGVRVVRGQADGVWRMGRVEGTPCIETQPGIGENRYLYFEIADPYYYDHHGTLTLRVTYLDNAGSPITVHYDAAGPGAAAVRDGAPRPGGAASEHGAAGAAGWVLDEGAPYEVLGETIARGGTGDWKTATLTLPNARCANRQNGGADFRFHARGEELRIRRIEITKLPADYGK